MTSATLWTVGEVKAGPPALPDGEAPPASWLRSAPSELSTRCRKVADGVAEWLGDLEARAGELDARARQLETRG